jgi:hypothetical protein
VPVNNSRDLYGLPLDRFIPERGALAKTLRGGGNKEEAARVAGLRKPSVAAWTVNQLIRTQRRAVTDLFEAGDELQRAQSEILAGRGDARVLREAGRRERGAVDGLTEVAGGLLSSDGQEPTRATLDRVAETLHAAAFDADARGAVREACLDRELKWVGFGAGEPAGAEHAERERAGRLKSARAAEAAARRLEVRTARELEAAQERRDRAATSLREAEAALAAAREEAEDAASAHLRAQQALEGL